MKKITNLFIFIFPNSKQKSLIPGRVVFVKSVSQSSSDSKTLTYRLAPLVLVESFTKDKNAVLALALDETSLLNENELWDQDDDDNDKMTSFFEKTNPTYENLIEKLKKLSVFCLFQILNNKSKTFVLI